MLPTDPQEIHSLILALKSSSACGADQIPVSVVKSVAGYISFPLASIINHSVQLGVFPNLLKVAKVVPIFKGGDKFSIANYRPISLLNTFSKIYEKFFLKRLQIFLDKHSILYDGQFGFRKNRSTQYALASFLDYVTEALDRNEHVLSLFIDLSKAFDTLDHSLLLRKLYNYGIRGIAYDFIKDYLSNRTQYVELNGVSSDLLTISCGVPQGSILGPVLFLLYINDIYTCSKLLKFFLFADDTTIVFSSKDLPTLFFLLNDELLLLSDWFASNKLSLNVSKSNFIVFNHNNRELDNLDLFLDGKKINRARTSKFLGVILDDNLSWHSHVSFVEKKLSSANFIIRKIRHKINQKTSLMLYDTLILPHLMYCSLNWGNTYKTYTLNIIRLQKRALRLCTVRTNLNTVELFAVTQRLPFVHLHNFQVALTVFKYLHNELALPKCISSLFKKIPDIHLHHTRSVDGMSLHTHFGRLNVRKNSLKICAPLVWNKIPPRIRQILNLSTFKKHYKTFLLSSILS